MQDQQRDHPTILIDNNPVPNPDIKLNSDIHLDPDPILNHFSNPGLQSNPIPSPNHYPDLNPDPDAAVLYPV